MKKITTKLIKGSLQTSFTIIYKIISLKNADYKYAFDLMFRITSISINNSKSQLNFNVNN